MKFSERLGYKKVRDSIQFESIDDNLRNGLWDCIRTQAGANDKFVLFFWKYYLKKTSDTCPMHGHNGLDIMGNYLGYDFDKVVQSAYFGGEWYEVYDILEFTCAYFVNIQEERGFQKKCNLILENEMSAYRFVDRKITAITDSQELESIQTAISESKTSVQSHLQRSLELLSDRQAPDYRNSIKESISAVESQLKIVLNSPKGTLGSLLTDYQKELGLHPALKGAFDKLYGYASQTARHGKAENDVAESDFHDAKYMLVVCSAFVSYLTGKTI